MSTILDEIVIIIIEKPIRFSFFYFTLLGLISIGLGVIYIFSYLTISPEDISSLKFSVFITLVLCGSLNICYSRKFSKAYEKLLRIYQIIGQEDNIKENLKVIRMAFVLILVSSLILTILSVVWNFELYLYYLESPADYYVFKFMIGFFIISFLGIFFSLSYISELYRL